MKATQAELAAAQTNRAGEIKQRRVELARRIDSLAREGCSIFSGVQSFESALASAELMKEMRDLLTPEVMGPIMELMNTDLGFQTDRPSDKHPAPYSMHEVRDVLCEALLRGFRPVGNEFNIIAKRFYPALNGFRRKLTDKQTFAGLRNLRDSYEVPKMTNGGAVIKCRAEWEIGGKKDSFEAEIAARLNTGMGVDAALGKAQRKLLKRVHDILAGYESPEFPEFEAVDVTPSTPPIDADSTAPSEPTPSGSDLHLSLEAFVVGDLGSSWSEFDDRVMREFAPGHEGKYKGFASLPASWVRKLLAKRKEIAEILKEEQP